MRIDILTVMPDALESPLHTSILQRAQDKGLVEIHVHNLRDWSLRKHRKVDDYPFGGEAGMVMQIEPVWRCMEELKSQREYDEIIFTSPDGEQLDQPMANALSLKENIMILCGHYKGVDYRIREHLITKEITIGDYVLTGGELPALVFVDTVGRLCEGVLADESCFTDESHFNGLLEYPQYSRPAVWHEKEVPGVLLSGHHANISRWRREQSLLRTCEKRPDLLEKAALNAVDLAFLQSVPKEK
ncbi:MAG TPA: tRNA (guanosine(37)-N1)-methyltransferase TrmD [Ruminococcaceae bacterium]|nr:tRNA (guanosine(37)-N1)-methyltransferase TrmD [Oscillospiraceae bacterium]